MQFLLHKKIMQKTIHLKILDHDEKISKLARKEYEKEHALFGRLEIGIDESTDELYGLEWEQEIDQVNICHLCNVKEFWH